MSQDRTLSPTQELMMDVLAARRRLGEHMWTFSARLRKTAVELEDMDLVWWKHGTVEKTILVGLTDAGVAEWLSATYTPPNAVEQAGAPLRAAAHLLEAAMLRDDVPVDERWTPTWLRRLASSPALLARGLRAVAQDGD